jgi:hypothetical protein
MVLNVELRPLRAGSCSPVAAEVSGVLPSGRYRTPPTVSLELLEPLELPDPLDLGGGV